MFTYEGVKQYPIMGDMYEHEYSDNDMIMESLPSGSKLYDNPDFLNKVNSFKGVQNSGEVAPLSASEFINNSTHSSEVPTRPPPRIEATGATPGSTSSTPTPGKKPFLRKGSRKEPSALHRIQGRASPITAGKSQRNSDTSPSVPKPFASEKSGEFGGSGVIEVLAKPPPMKSPPPKHINPRSGGSSSSTEVDPNETSGTFEVEWSALDAKRNEKMRQLDEFSVLEQELEGMTQLDPFATSKGAPVRNSWGSVRNSRVLEAVDNTGNDDEDNGGDDDFGRYSQDFEPEEEEGHARAPRGTSTTSNGKPPLPSGLGGVRSSRELLQDTSGGLTAAGRVRQSMEQRQLEARERALLGFDEGEDEEEESYVPYEAKETSKWRRQPYPGERGYEESPKEAPDATDKLSSAGRTLHQKQVQQQRQHELQRRSRDDADETAAEALDDRGASSPGPTPSSYRGSSPGHRGRGVHGEGGAMSGLLDHSTGPMVNRPPSTFSKRPPSVGSKGLPTEGRVRSSAARPASAGSGGRNNREGGPRSSAQDDEAAASLSAAGLRAKQQDLNVKASELEKELATYKQENAKLRTLRKQADQALETATRQKAEMSKWAEEEKKKTEEFCAEQRRIATKERRNAAKIASDARRDGLTTSTRKAAADMEVLEATNARLVAEHEAGAKKARLTERRLHGIIKEQGGTIDDLKSQIAVMEENHRTIKAYLDRIGVRLPAGMARNTTTNARGVHAVSGGSGSDLKKTHHKGTKASQAPVAAPAAAPATGEGRSGDMWTTRSRVLLEEVGDVRRPADLDDAMVRRGGLGSTYGEGQVMDASLSEARDVPTGALSSALFGRGLDRRTQGEGDGHGEAEGEEREEEREEEESELSGLNRASGAYHPDKYVGRSTASSQEGSVRVSGTGHPGQPGEEESSLMMVPLRNSDDMRASTSSLQGSWARSSGSSGEGRRGDRYASTEEEEDISYSTGGGGSYKLPTSTSSGNGSSSGSGGGGHSSRSEEMLADGRKLVRYRNGTVKEVHPTGSTVVRFVNGDTKRTDTDGTVVYYYCEADTTHTTYTTGVEVYEFPNGQTERHHADGLKEIYFPDQTRKLIYPSGVQESTFPDGVKVKEFPSGEKVVVGADGHEVAA